MSKKRILITGASGGVGSLLSIGLAKKGYHIICVGRNKHNLKKLVDKINLTEKATNGSASFEITDLMNVNQVAEIGLKAKREFGKIDVWINNVGVNNHNAIGPTWELKPENWKTEVDLNLNTTFIGTHTAINLMKNAESGYIINLGGGGVQESKPFGSAYGAAKTAIVKFSETVNIELKEAGFNIKVFAFNPGFIKNERTELLVESDIARKYMPNLETIFKYGEMSNPQDSIDLVQTIIDGHADKLAGMYFFADDKNIFNLIEDCDNCVENELNLLRVKKHKQ